MADVWFAQKENVRKQNEYFRFQTKEELRDHIPAIYDIHGNVIEGGANCFYCGWEIASLGFIWLIAKYDYNSNLAHGYVCLGIEGDAEFGCIDMSELEQNFRYLAKENGKNAKEVIMLNNQLHCMIMVKKENRMNTT